MGAKRKRETIIQAWFDPDDHDHKFVIDIYEFFKTKMKMSARQIIGLAIMALYERYESDGEIDVTFDEKPKNMEYDRMFQVLVNRIDEIYKILENGASIHLPEHPQSGYHEEPIGELEKSIAGRYHFIGDGDG